MEQLKTPERRLEYVEVSLDQAEGDWERSNEALTVHDDTDLANAFTLSAIACSLNAIGVALYDEMLRRHG